MSLFVHHTPHVRDICEHERHEERHVEHGAQSELAAAAVADGERALQVGVTMAMSVVSNTNPKDSTSAR